MKRYNCENEDNSSQLRKCVLFVRGHVSSRANRRCALTATLVPRVNQTNRDNHSLRAFSVAGYRGLTSPISVQSVFPLVAGNVEVTRTANESHFPYIRIEKL